MSLMCTVTRMEGTWGTKASMPLPRATMLEQVMQGTPQTDNDADSQAQHTTLEQTPIKSPAQQGQLQHHLLAQQRAKPGA